MNVGMLVCCYILSVLAWHELTIVSQVDRSTLSYLPSQTSGKLAVARMRTVNATVAGSATLCTYDLPRKSLYRLSAQVND